MTVEVLGPVAYRPFELDRVCQESIGHTHNYDHVTFVQSGALKVYYRRPGEDEERESRVFRVGEFFLVKAEVLHRIKAVEPNTRYACVFTHRDFEGQVIQEYNGNEAAYV